MTDQRKELALPQWFGALPDYAFPRLRQLLDHLPPGQAAEGAGIIAMSIGEPMHEAPAFVRPILDAHFADLRRYPPNEGDEPWRAAVLGWLNRRYDLPAAWMADHLNIVPLNGTREGLFMAVQALVPEQRRGQRPTVLLPNPFYQCYAAATLAAGAEPIFVPATAENGFLPDFGSLPKAILDRAVMAFLCSPTNPQGAVAKAQDWANLLHLAETHDFWVMADECYAEIWRDTPPPGVLEICRAQGFDPARVLSFHSLSKRSNLAGLRSGFAAGGKTAIAALTKLKSYGGAPVPIPTLRASAAAWSDEAHVIANRALYSEKYLLADQILGDLSGYTAPEAGFFLWIDVTKLGHTDGEAAARLLWQQAGLRVLPGAYLSRQVAGVDPGAAYIRVALVESAARVALGLQALRHVLVR